MKYKEFIEWCNQRACDGCWGILTAKFCIDIMREVQDQFPWKREKRWQELEKEYSIVEKVITPTNNKIKEMYG